jgi:hypothetical protein
MELDEWHPRQDVPNNAEKIREKELSARPELQWLAGYLDSGVLTDQVPDRDGVVVYASDFFDRARRTARLGGWTDNRFAAFLKEWGVTRKRSGTSQWAFPPLEDMRAEWHRRYPWWRAFDDTVTQWMDADAEDPEEMDFG